MRCTIRNSPVVACALLFLAALGCDEDLDPQFLIKNLRILAISADPADLVLGETMALDALVATPGDTEVEYHWEWCPFTAGADELFACMSEEADPELAALFDLGNAPTATLDSNDVVLLLAGICEVLGEGLDDLGEYADLLESFQLPDCELGMDITVRLTVSTGDIERVAIKRVFIWLSEPEDLQRNRNPVIDGIVVNDQDFPEDYFVWAEPATALDWYVDVPADALEPFLLRSDPNAEQRRESITYTFFTTAGGWKAESGFADDEYVNREDAGEARLVLPEESRTTPINTYFVVRDERGGITWATRQVRMLE